MKTRLVLDVFLEELTEKELEMLRGIKAKSFKVKGENSTASTHDCYHDEKKGKPCNNVKEL